MGYIIAVNWDVDRVWYPGISSSYCAGQNPQDPEPHLKRFLKGGLFTEDDVTKWAEYAGKDTSDPIQSVGDLADCLTALYHDIKNPDGKRVLEKSQTVEAKQSLLRGMTMEQVRDIADGVELTPGLQKAIEEFNKSGVRQVAFSDGFGPFVSYVARREGMGYWGVVPAIVKADGKETIFTNEMIDSDVVMTGKAEPYIKADAFFALSERRGYKPSDLAAIDDSETNIPTLKRIQEGGGVAIGFNPSESGAPKFRQAGIPILQQEERTLEPFIEIVLDPTDATIGKYCL
ncbi:MAG: hypothetical protein ISS93_00190 [Candidatus Aenigmarchaeota archaeon]|nr:hypothetical protein [Candidatus Aenigmarchaeota archaeon]